MNYTTDSLERLPASAGSGGRYAKWYASMRADPARWAQRMAEQRERRQRPVVNEVQRKQAREQWANLPADHPRKRRKQQRKPATQKARAARAMERLSDGTVATRYLHMRVSECPKELIMIKREHIRLSRKLKTSIKTL